MGASRVDDPEGASYIGWIAGFVVIFAVFAVGAALWFMYHPL